VKTKLKALIAHIKKIIADGFVSFLKDTVKGKIATIATILLGIAGTVSAVNPQMIGNMYRSVITDDESKQTILLLHEELRQLRGEWKSAEQTNFYERRQFEQAFKSFAEVTDKNFRIIHDSLIRQNKRLEAFSQGSGTVNISGGGEVRSGIYSDDWIDAYVEMDSNGTRINYAMNFKVKDVSTKYEDEKDGSVKEIFSVKLQSSKDPESTYDVEDYKRWTTTFAEDPKPVIPEEKQSDAINLNIAYAGYGAEVGLSYSLWTFGNFRLIDFGASSDFQESTNISAGARYNIGSVIPLLQDLYFGIHYGYNFGKQKSNALVMIGTTL